MSVVCSPASNCRRDDGFLTLGTLASLNANLVPSISAFMVSKKMVVLVHRRLKGLNRQVGISLCVDDVDVLTLQISTQC